MSRLLVVVYPELRRAGEVLAALRQRHEKALADLDEAIYVTGGRAATSSCTRAWAWSARRRSAMRRSAC
jgi:uncharacterized membrane protein